MENENDIRQLKIIGILNQEIEDGQDLANEARRTVEYLLLQKKGYSLEEVSKNAVFELKLEKETAYSSVDFLVRVAGKNAMIIKCAAGSLVSRERQALAAARLIAQPPVPIAVVVDPVTAEVLDTATGEVIGEGFGAIPVREQIESLLAQKVSEPLPPARLEREKRILLAFDAIRCSVPQGGDGGVHLDKERGS